MLAVGGSELQIRVGVKSKKLCQARRRLGGL